MDPVSATFGLAASITTLVSLVERLAKSVNKYKDFKTTLETLSQDVTGLLMIVHLVKTTVENAGGILDSLKVDHNNQETPALIFFNKEVESIAIELDQLLDVIQNGEKSPWWQKWISSVTKYIHKESKMEALTVRMARAQFNLVTIMSVASIQMQADAITPPAWISDIEKAMHQIPGINDTVKRIVATQFTTNNEKMVQEQEQIGSSSSTSYQGKLPSSNKSDTSLGGSVRSSLVFRNKHSKQRRSQRSSLKTTENRVNMNVQSGNDCRSVTGGGSTTEPTPQHQTSFHEADTDDFTERAILDDLNDHTPSSGPKVERPTSEALCNLSDNGKSHNNLTTVSHATPEVSVSSSRSADEILETSSSGRQRRISNASSISTDSYSEPVISESSSQRMRVPEGSIDSQSNHSSAYIWEAKDDENFDYGAEQSECAASAPGSEIRFTQYFGDYRDTFELVMNVKKKRTEEIPDRVEFDKLLHFMLLAERHELDKETVEQAITWSDHLKGTLPTSLDQRLISWLWIAWKLDLKREFKALSAIAQREARGRIDQDDRCQVALPNFIPDLIQNKRVEVLSSVNHLFEKLIEDTERDYNRIFTDGLVRNRCGQILMKSLVFGYLILERNRWKLRSSMTEFDGLSFSDVCCFSNALMDIGEWCICGPQSERDQMSLYASLFIIPPTVSISPSIQIDLKGLISRLEISDWGIDLTNEMQSGLV